MANICLTISIVAVLLIFPLQKNDGTVDGFPSAAQEAKETTTATNNQQETQNTDNSQSIFTTNSPSILQQQMTTVIIPTTEGVEVETMATTALIDLSDGSTATTQVSDINEETSSTPTTSSTHNEILPTLMPTTMMSESTSTTSSSTFERESTTEMNVFETNRKPPEVNVGQTKSPILPSTTSTPSSQTLNDDKDENMDVVFTEKATTTVTDENGIKQIMMVEQNNTVKLKTTTAIAPPSMEKTEQQNNPNETDNEESTKMEPTEEKIGPTETQIRPTTPVTAIIATSTSSSEKPNTDSVPEVYFSPPTSTPPITIMKIDGPVTQPVYFLHENCHNYHQDEPNDAVQHNNDGQWEQSFVTDTPKNENWTPLTSLKPSPAVILLETFYCSEPGLFQHPSPTSCNQFLQCDWTGQLPFVLSCGEDTYWDDFRKQCGWSCVRS